MGTTAPVKRVVTVPKRAGNPYIVVPSVPEPAPAAPEREPEPVPAR